MDIKTCAGGLCAAKGFKASGLWCGIRRNRLKRDLALIFSEVPCSAAAVYTQNKVTGAPNQVTKKHLADGKAQAVVCNSGNANTCNADGIEKAEAMASLTAKLLGIAPEDVIVGSTGVIGQPLPLEPIQTHLPELAAQLSADGSPLAAEAIMTTDTVKKEFSYEFTLGGKVCHLGGIAKGSGMIHPNMATMLAFLTTDASISAPMLQKALSDVVKDTFNMISVDGDTSTNDMVTVLANGLAGNRTVDAEDADYAVFHEALKTLAVSLCRSLAADGEGATKLLICEVSHAPTVATAKLVAKSVICSTLLKAAMFGADANWGRVLCAIGYADACFDIMKVGVDFESAAGKIAVCRDGAGVPFSEEEAKKILLEKEIHILVDLGQGDASSTAWGCDLTYDSVKINGDYRT